MFENDDWDFDQDFLNDVDDKVIRYCSQRDNHEKEVKRRKIEINDDPIFSSNFDDDPWNEQPKTYNETVAKRNENSQSRKNLILGIFNKNLPEKCTNASNSAERSRDDISSNSKATCSEGCDSNQSTRKNLVLKILQNKNAPDKTAENSRNNVDLKKTGQRIPPTRKITENQEARGKCNSAKTNSKAASSSSFDASAASSSTKENSWKRQSAEKSTPRSEPKNVSPPNNLRIFKPAPQTSPSKKLTLVRKFPGPAGLLPDDIDSNIPCVSYLNSLEEKERASQEAESEDPAGYCSQNTKNLFTEGAWQLMLDDLPADFLNGHDLATVKRTANLNGLNSMKVEFLAGIVEHIDYSHDNPPIVLKDFTDDIRGIVHKDVPLKYPGLLETNVVILLHDVGLLRISDTFVSNKYQLLIFPSSLLAIYTSKGEIKRTQHMNAIFRSTSDASGEAKEKCVLETTSKTGASFDAKGSGSSSKGPTKSQENASSKNADSFDVLNKASSSKVEIENVDFEPMDFDPIQFDAKNNSTINKEPINSGNSNRKCFETENTNVSMDLDSDLSFSVAPIQITDSRNQNNFNSSTLTNSKHAKRENKTLNSTGEEKTNARNDEKERGRDLSAILNKFQPDRNEKRLSRDSKASPTNSKYSLPKAGCSKQMKSEALTDIFSEKLEFDDERSANDASANKLNRVEETVSPCSSSKKSEDAQKSASSVRSRLLQFKSEDALTPSENSVAKPAPNSPKTSEKLAEMRSLPSCSKHGVFNDSDDEILSQMDIDVIFSNYKDDGVS